MAKKKTRAKTAGRTAGGRGKKAAPTKKKRAPARAKRAPGANPEAQMAAWQAAMTPGAAHQRLTDIVGTFEAKTTFWMAPGAPPSSGDGVSEHRWVLGGRFVEQNYKGTTMGMPFEGVGYTGYDNVRRCYVGSWMDSMGTGIMNSVGKGKPTGAKMTFVSRMHDPLTRKEVVSDAILKVQDRDHHSYEMWGPSPSGKRYRMMLVEYTRKP